MTGSDLPTFSSKPAESMWARVRERTAMIGAFDPIALIGRPDSVPALEVLTAIGNECIEIVSTSLPRWQLSPDVRRRVLLRLQADGRLTTVAEAADPVDDFGRYLVDAVLGRLHIPDQASLSELDTIRTAVQFFATISPGHNDFEEIDRAVSRREKRDAIHWLLPCGLVGREHQLRRLRDFAYAPARRSQTMLMVSGTGGVGKSALLAEFVRRTDRRFGEKRPIVWLDFDRAVLATAEPAVMLEELARQLGHAVPALSAPLADFRGALAERFDYGADVESHDFSLRSSRHSGEWSLWNEYGIARAVRDLPVILILDTIEELLVHQDGRSDVLINWLDALTTEGGMRQVRPILSGRSHRRFIDWLPGGKSQHVRVGDLGPVSAVRLLERHLRASSVPMAQIPAEELVEHYGGNPLTLNVMARYLSTEGPSAAAGLLEEAGNRRFSTSFAQHYLYKRILGRIRSDDADLVSVAHPGLVLRRVTPALIELVLAGPCGLGVIDGSRADKLFDALAQQIWLVEPSDHARAVRHRRDLRRLIFASMNASEEEKARAIHTAAAEYYAAYRDPLLSAANQRTEALYHRVFSDPDLKLDDTELRALARALGEDVTDLPIAYRARLKLAAGRGLEVDESESLDADRFEAYEDERERSSFKRGRDPTTPDRLPTSRAVNNPSIAAERAYVAGDLEAVVALEFDVLDEFAEEVLLGRWRSRRLPADLTEFAIWRVAIARIGRPGERALASALIERTEKAGRRVEWARPLNPNRKISISLARAVSAIIVLLGSNAPSFLGDNDDSNHTEGEIGTIEALRVRQLLRHERTKGRPVRVELPLLRYLDARFGTLNSRGSGSLLTLHPIAQDTIDSVLTGSRSRRPSLADLDRPRARQAYVEARPEAFANPASADLLRGVSPELYPLVLAGARIQPAATLVAFAERVEARLPQWPRELTARQFAKSLERDRERWTGTLIEVADRCNELGHLIDALAGETKAGAALGRVISRYSRRLRS